MLLPSVSVLETFGGTVVALYSWIVFWYISAKKGTCPVPSDDRSTCVEPSHECSVDHDCDGDMKCCEQSCGRVCVEPDIEGMSSYLTNLTYKL